MSNEIFRLQFLKTCVGFIAGAGSTTLLGGYSTVLAQSDRWFCPESGCPPLPVDNRQEHWHYCNKCQAMFYQGAPGSLYDQRKGVCAAGGAHEPAGYNFTLPHDIPGTPTAQTDWHYCNKCQALFYQGAPGSLYDQRKGVCAAGGAHEPAGHNFVLPWYKPAYIG